MRTEVMLRASAASPARPAARPARAWRAASITRAAIQSSSREPSSGGVGRRRLLAALPPCGCSLCAAKAARAAAAEQRPRNALLDASFAEAMNSGMQEYEQTIAPVKQRLFDELLTSISGGAGDGGGSSAAAPLPLLELGVGTGPNLPYYASHPAASSLHITGLDPNSYMRPFLEANRQRSGWPEARLTWVQGDAAAMPFEDASMDAVVCTLVSLFSVCLASCRLFGGACLCLVGTAGRVQCVSCSMCAACAPALRK